MITFFSFMPVVMLVYLMTKKNGMPAFKALPLTALCMYILSLVLFDRGFVEVNATVIHGILTALTPITIIWGAIFLFKTMEMTGGMKVVQSWLNTVTPNKVAQLMIVGWAFPFLIEGASGFGTPAALAAPVLVGLGFPAVRVAIMTLMMDTVPVTFGAVGTPTWFGLSGVKNLSAEQLAEVGVKSALIHGVAALIIPLIALSFVVSCKEIRKNIVFVFLSIFVTVAPYIAVSFFSYEFPSLVGGFVGIILSVAIAKMGWGLSKEGGVNLPENRKSPSIGELVKASFPLWGTLLLLVVTRIQQFGIKALLVNTDSFLSADLGGFGIFKISPSLVLSLENILGVGITWNHKLLYIPSLVPFGIISLITFLVYRSRFKSSVGVLKQSLVQMKHPIVTLFGALVFVGLMMMGDGSSAVSNIGQALAYLCGGGWQVFASYLGAVGSFFSGSNTISNLTFAGVQDSIAISMNLDRTTILALQSVGGAMGNMVCINAIVAVCSVLGLKNQEGYILKRTVLPMIIYGIIAAAVSYLV